MGELFATLKLDDKDFNKGLSTSKSSFDGLKNVISKGTQTAAKAFAGTTVAVAGLGLAALKVGLDYNRMQQSSRAALTTLLGSAEAANAQMDKLDDFARNSPFAKQVFIQAQQQLLGFGVAAEDVIPTLDAVQNAVASVGGSNDQVSNVTYALAQMQGQGKLTGETLNQLGQYGINAAEILGKEMGKSGEEIRKLASKPGGIPVDQVFKPLTDGLMKRFGGATANIKEQMDGAADRIKGAWRDIGSALAEPFVDPKGGGMAVVWTNKVADAMRALETKIKPLVALLQDRFQPQLDMITPALDKVRGAINSWDLSKVNGQLDELTKYSPLIATVAAGLFAMGTNVPILASLGLTLNPVVAALGALALTSPQVRDAFSRLFDSLQPLVPLLAQAGIQIADVLVHAIETLAPAIGDLAEGFGNAGVHLISGFLPGIMGLMTAATPLIDVVASLVSFIGELPTPLLAVGLAMAALHGPVGSLVTTLGGAAVTAFKTLNENMQASKGVAEAMGAPMGAMGTAAMTARAGVSSLGTALKVAFISNGIGLAIMGVTAALGFFINAQADARARSEEFRATLDQTTGAITEQSRALMFDEINADKKFEQISNQAKILGLEMEDLIAITLGETTPSLDRLSESIDENKDLVAETTGRYNEQTQATKDLIQESRVEAGLRENLSGLTEKNSEALEYNKRKLEAVRGAQSDARSATTGHTDALKEQIDAQREAEDAALSQAEALLRSKDAEDRAAEAVRAHTELQKSGKASTEELERSARNMETQNLGMVRSYKGVTDSMERNNASAKDLDDVIRKQRETFIKQRIAMGDSKAEAHALANELGLIPNRVYTEFVMSGIGDANSRASTLMNTLNNINGKQVTAYMAVKQYGQAAVADGGILYNGVHSFADGGVRGKLPSQAMIQSAQQNLVQWAEPETHGEAFIPLAPAKRARSLQILDEVASRFGRFTVPSFADGGFHNAGVPGASVAGGGFDYDRLAAAITRSQGRSGAEITINQTNHNPIDVPVVEQTQKALAAVAAMGVLGLV